MPHEVLLEWCAICESETPCDCDDQDEIDTVDLAPTRSIAIYSDDERIIVHPLEDHDPGDADGS